MNPLIIVALIALTIGAIANLQEPAPQIEIVNCHQDSIAPDDCVEGQVFLDCEAIDNEAVFDSEHCIKRVQYCHAMHPNPMICEVKEK